MARRNTKIQRYKNIIKGRVFEFVIKKIIEKAGFRTDIDIGQLTKTKKKLHGRGSTYAADFIGLFSFNIPFSYPFLLVGEAKYHKKKIGIGEVRSFLGAYIDVSQYPRINTKSRTLFKYSQIFQEGRYRYIPVIFSRKGFARNAQALMFTHGVNFISYENSFVFQGIEKKIETFLKKIDYKKITNKEIKKMISLESFRELVNYAKREGYEEALNNLFTVLDPIKSYIGLLDNLWPINFLSKNKNPIKPLTKIKDCNFKIDSDQIIVKKTTHPNSTRMGSFSLPPYFLKEYKKEADKKGKEILCELTLYIPLDEKIFPLYIKLMGGGDNK